MNEFWNIIRDLISELTVREGWSQSKLASKARIGQSTLSMFLSNPSRGMQQRTLDRLTPVLKQQFPDRFPDSSSARVSKNGTGHLHSKGAVFSPGIRMIPVVDVRRYPVQWTTKEELLERVGEIASDWIVVPASDPLAHAVIISYAIDGRTRPGARLVVGPKTPALEGDFVAVVRDGALRIAEVLDFAGEPALRFIPTPESRTGDVLLEKDFEVVGKILADYNPW